MSAAIGLNGSTRTHRIAAMQPREPAPTTLTRLPPADPPAADALRALADHGAHFVLAESTSKRPISKAWEAAPPDFAAGARVGRQRRAGRRGAVEPGRRGGGRRRRCTGAAGGPVRPADRHAARRWAPFLVPGTRWRSAKPEMAAWRRAREPRIRGAVGPGRRRVCFTCAKRQRQRSATPHDGQPEQRVMAAFQALREARAAEQQAFNEYVAAVNQRSD